MQWEGFEVRFLTLFLFFVQPVVEELQALGVAAESEGAQAIFTEVIPKFQS